MSARVQEKAVLHLCSYLVEGDDARFQPRAVFRVRVRLFLCQTRHLEHVDGQAGIVPPARPLRVQLPRHLEFGQRERVVELVDLFGAAPIFGRGELGVGAWDVKLARAEEATGSGSEFD